MLSSVRWYLDLYEECVLEKPRGVKQGLLEPYREEIERMRSEGFSYRQIAEWLEKKGVVVNKVTVGRFCSSK